MKKILLILLFLGISFPAMATTCADGAGVLLYGKNETAYCMSNRKMNWWSAIAWCRSLGQNAHLIDVTSECPYSGGTSECPNLENSDLDSEIFVWTINAMSSNSSYSIRLKNGTFRSIWDSSRTNTYHALCVGF